MMIRCMTNVKSVGTMVIATHFKNLWFNEKKKKVLTQELYAAFAVTFSCRQNFPCIVIAVSTTVENFHIMRPSLQLLLL